MIESLDPFKAFVIFGVYYVRKSVFVSVSVSYLFLFLSLFLSLFLFCLCFCFFVVYFLSLFLFSVRELKIRELFGLFMLKLFCTLILHYIHNVTLKLLLLEDISPNF